MLSFFLAYERDYQLILDHKTIAFHYLTNNFAFDFMSTIPGLITGELFYHIYPLKVLRYIQLSIFFAQLENLLRSLSHLFTWLDKHFVK